MPRTPPPDPEPSDIPLTARDFSESEQRRRLDYLLKVGGGVCLLMAAIMGAFVHPGLGLLNAVGGICLFSCLRWALSGPGTDRIEPALTPDGRGRRCAREIRIGDRE